MEDVDADCLITDDVNLDHLVEGRLSGVSTVKLSHLFIINKYLMRR